MWDTNACRLDFSSLSFLGQLPKCCISKLEEGVRFGSWTDSTFTELLSSFSYRPSEQHWIAFIFIKQQQESLHGKPWSSVLHKTALADALILQAISAINLCKSSPSPIRKPSVRKFNKLPVLGAVISLQLGRTQCPSLLLTIIRIIVNVLWEVIQYQGNFWDTVDKFKAFYCANITVTSDILKQFTMIMSMQCEDK